MKVQIRLVGGDEAKISTEHSASSYGQAVLIWQGEAYGPGDVLPEGEYPAELEWLRDEPKPTRWAWRIVQDALSRYHPHGESYDGPEQQQRNELGCIWHPPVCGDSQAWTMDGPESSELNLPAHWEHSPECELIRQFIALGKAANVSYA